MDVNLFEVNVLLILICIASTLTILAYYKTCTVHTYWKKRGVPYESSTCPILGNLSFLMRKSASEFFDGLCKKHPVDFLGVLLGWQPALVIQTPELARQILVRDTESFQDRYMYSSPSDSLGTLNLFTVKSPIWTKMRHELSPMFTPARLKLFTKMININAEELVRRIQHKYIDEKKLPVNLRELFMMYTSDTAGFTVFGLHVSSLSGSDSPLWTISSHMVKWTFARGLEFHCVLLMPYIARLIRLKFFSSRATEYIQQLFWNVVKERENSKSSNNIDLVNHLLKLNENFKLPAEPGSPLADNLLLAQAAIFIFGAVHNSSTTLSYCLHELAHNAKAQDKLYNEINQAMREKGKEVLEYDDLIELKYLSACIYETLRKHPPVPYLDRKCNKPYTLQGVKIEPGVPVLVNVIAIHHDPRHWPEPEKWDPERPCASTDNDNMNYTFLPFGEGPRFCIGKRYAMMQIRAALSQLIHKYRVEPGPFPYQLKPDPYSILLAPKNGGSVKFIAR